MDGFSGDVYVLDKGNARVVKYDADGSFVATWGWGVDDGAAASQVCTLDCQAGIVGSGPGQLSNPNAIAVDNSLPLSSGAVYVSDQETKTVVKFSSEGVYLATIAGSPGVPFSAPIGVAVGTDGDLWVADASQINRFDSAGVFKTSWSTNLARSAPGLAVDSTDDVYLGLPFGFTSEGTVGKYNADGTGGDSIARGTPMTGFGIDQVTNDLFILSGSTTVDKYAAEDVVGEDTLLASFGSLSSGTAVAVNSVSGNVYVTDAGAGQVVRFKQVVLPDVATGSASGLLEEGATLSGTVDPNGTATSYQFEYGLDSSYGSVAPMALGDAGDGSGDVPVTSDVTGLQPGTVYHFRLNATNANGTANGEDQTFITPGPPMLSSVSAGLFGLTTARLFATINPLGAETTYRFEYGPTDSYGASVPVPDGTVAAGFGNQDVSVPIAGLERDTTYHFRVVAENSYGTTVGEDGAPDDKTFRTADLIVHATEVNSTDVQLTGETFDPPDGVTTYHFEYGPTAAYGTSTPDSETRTTDMASRLTGLVPDRLYHWRLVVENSFYGTVASRDMVFKTTKLVGEVALPDNRAYEMVTPPDKNGGRVFIKGSTTFVAPDGNAVGYAAKANVGETSGTGSLGGTQYRAVRSGDRWVSRGITPTPHPVFDQIFGGTTAVFSEDLTRAAVTTYDLPYISGDVKDSPRNIYRETVATGDLLPVMTPLVGAVPASQGGSFVGGSSDFGHVVFQSGANLLPGTTGAAPKVYDWDNGTLKLAGILPDGTLPDGSVGSRAARPIDRWMRDTVSRDGTRILFRTSVAGSDQLYMRRQASDTVWLSEPEGGPVSLPQDVRFEAASPDLAKVAFSTPDPLVDSDPGGSGRGIYLFTNSPDPSADSNLTFIGRFDGGDPAVLGMTDDGTRGLINTGDAWGPGGVTHVVDGFPNASNEYDWNGLHHPEDTLAAVSVSGDGRRLAWLQRDRARDSGRDAQAGLTALYTYDETHGVTCASCPTSGASAQSDATITPYSGSESPAGMASLTKSRFFTRDGRKVFFDTGDALVPEDVNGRVDAYVYDLDEQVAHLISSGRSEEDSWFSTASPDGHDAFFVTSESLSRWDNDGAYDLYDARVDGGLPKPPAAPEGCEGEACRGQRGAAPAGSSPGSRDGTATGDGPSARRATLAVGALSRGQRVRLARNGRVTLSVRVNRPGWVRTKIVGRIGNRDRVLARASRRAGRAGTVRVSLRLSDAGRTALRRRQRLTLTFSVAFTGVREPHRFSVKLAAASTSTVTR